MNIRYYEIKMWEKYKHKIYLNIKAALYNTFISVTYSHCPQIECNSDKTHYSSLIIFNYPNSTDNSLNIIPELYNSNKNIENDFSFNFEGKINIENNLFGYVYKGTKIMNIPTGLYLRNITNGNNLINESIILKDENVSLYFDSNEEYKKGNYIIEYAYVLTEPNYEDINTYANTTETKGENINEKNYTQYNEYTGKSSNFTVIISDDLITNCKDEKCALCFKNFACITCKYNYTFNSNTKEKTCLPEHSKLTTIPKQSLTTTITTILTTTPKIKTTISKIPTTTIKIPKIKATIQKIPTTTIKIQKIQTTFQKIPTTIQKITTTIPFIFTTIPKTIIHTTSLKANPKQECTVEDIVKGEYKGKMTNEQIKKIRK